LINAKIFIIKTNLKINDNLALVRLILHRIRLQKLTLRFT